MNRTQKILGDICRPRNGCIYTLYIILWLAIYVGIGVVAFAFALNLPAWG